MTPDEAVAKLSTVDVEHKDDIGMIHGMADEILLDLIPVKVREAYDRLVGRVGGFQY